MTYNERVKMKPTMSKQTAISQAIEKIKSKAQYENVHVAAGLEYAIEILRELQPDEREQIEDAKPIMQSDEMVDQLARKFYFGRTGKSFAESSRPDMVIGFVEGWRMAKTVKPDITNPVKDEELKAGKVMTGSEWLKHINGDKESGLGGNILDAYASYRLQAENGERWNDDDMENSFTAGFNFHNEVMNVIKTGISDGSPNVTDFLKAYKKKYRPNNTTSRSNCRLS
jgi:hypothetical protein